MPSYKLTYFDAHGKGEVARLLFHLAGVEFEDFRVSKEEWPSIKASTPFGQVPTLEVDGKMYGQSNAIYSYLAREFGFYGKTTLEQLQVDQVMGLLNDFISHAVNVMFNTSDDKKEEAMKTLKEETMPKFIGYFEKLLKENGSNGYFVGDSITLADLAVFQLVGDIKQRMNIDNISAELQKLSESVKENPKLKAYLDARKPIAP